MIKKASFVLFLVFILISQAFSLPPCFPPFQHGVDYNTGNQVSHLGRNYQANWGTREVPGVTNWGGWRLLGECVHETILDSSKGRTPESIESISQFLLFASGNLILNSGVVIAGNIGANGNVSVGNMAAGWNTRVNGDIYAKGKVSTIAEAVINGNVFANGGLELGWNAKHNGELITNHSFNFTVPRDTVQFSNNDVNGAWRRDVELAPGNYRNVSVSDGGSLKLSAGTYNLNILSMNSANLPINLNLAPGESIRLNVQDSIQFGSGGRIVFSGKTSPLSFRIYTNQTKDLIIPDHSEINAIITAPNARVIVNSNARVNGAIYAREIVVMAGAVINSIPYLTDIFHSSYNFAPNFDIKTDRYFSVIPMEESSRLVEAIAPERFVVSTSNTGYRYLIEVEDPISGLVSYYNFEIRKNHNHSIFVHSGNLNGNGSSWASPMNCLQRAIDVAKTTGQRILVAEGNYGNIVVRQGTKITGGFEKSETNGEPEGSLYETIISGNNNTQAVVIKGFENAKSVKIKGFTIQNGRSETNGGGIYSRNVIPKFEEFVVRNNIAKENGAGIFAPRGVQDLHMILIENNTGKSAFYIGGNEDNQIRAERVIISENSGIGLDVRNANVLFVNSVFYGNKTAVSSDNSKLEIIHCTFAKNDVGVATNNSKVRVVNTILWNEGRGKELVGEGFDVSYSLVGNDPLFVDLSKPRGSDGEWGTLDDGLRLQNNSPAIDRGKDAGVEEDIIETVRPLDNGFDMGAYEFYLPPMPERASDFLGYFDADGKFNYTTKSPRIFTGIQFMSQLRFAAKTDHANFVRIKIPKKRRTDVSRVHFDIIGLDDDNKPLDGARKITIRANRAGSQGNNYVFISNKPIVFIDNPRLQGEHDFCYAVYMRSTNIRYELKHSQF